jgi:hypothetical protein
MKALVYLLKILLYVPVVMLEYSLMCLLDLVRHIKKAFEQ